jgi:GMP synthase (glutamine-hydrolysing)
MSDAVAITHVPFEDLGHFAPILEARGFALRYLDAPLDDLTPAARADLLVVLGGPISVNDGTDYPFLADEIGLLEDRLTAGRPTLGLCLGAQLMARALGARVYPGEAKEIGWGPVALSEVGRESPLRHLADTPVLHWHGETFELPDGAAHLAATPVCRNQAFALGAHALALQFHPEVTARGLERWYVGHTAEIVATPGVTVPALRAAAARHAEGLAARGRLLLEEWLDRL